MQQVLLIIHLLIAVALVGVVLLQRSEGGALGMGGGGMGGGGGGGNLMSVRGTANLLTRVTAILAASFMASSMALAILASRDNDGASVFDQIPATIEQPAGETGESLADELLRDSEPATNVPLD